MSEAATRTVDGVEAVRWPLSVRKSTHRTLDQRLSVWLPWLARLNLRLLDRLPPESRLRQRLLRRAMRLGIEAFNRRDLDAMLVPYDPHARLEPPREFVALGTSPPSFGVAEGLGRLWEEFFPAWGELRLEPREVLDLGDRAVLLADARGEGASSGAAMSGSYATILTFERGRIIRQQEFLDHGEALEAAGLPAPSSAQPAQKSS